MTLDKIFNNICYKIILRARYIQDSESKNECIMHLTGLKKEIESYLSQLSNTKQREL